MTSLADLVASVITTTNRPDLVAETTLAIRKATLKEHAAIDYPRDLVTTGHITLTNPTDSSRYSLSLVTLGIYNLVRKVDTIYEVLATEQSASLSRSGYYGALQFSEVDPKALFDEYSIEKLDYFYRQGNSIEIVAARQLNAIAIKYFARPDIGATTYSSWIADLYDYAIYEAAAADIFKLIGKRDEAQEYVRKQQDNRMDIIKNEVGSIG
jgi:hypothetical protein